MANTPTTKGSPLKASIFLLGIICVVALLIQVMRSINPERSLPPTTSTTSTIPTTPGTATSSIPLPPLGNPPITTTSTVPTTPSDEAVRPVPPGMICGDRNFLCIAESFKNAVFTSPMTVTGTAIAFENTFQWRLEDDSPTHFVLGEGAIMANAADVGQAGPFSERLFQSSTFPRTLTGTLTLFESSAKDGSPLHILSVPVRFSSTQGKKVKIYVVDNTNKQSCAEAVVPVEETIGAASAPIEATLRRLIDIGAEGMSNNYSSLIPAGTKLISLVLKNGVVTVVFDQQLESGGGGSCRVGAIRAQIEQTLKQFSSVKDVVIQVQGKTAGETLQP